MGEVISGQFGTRREAELAVERLVQEHHLDRKGVTIRAAGAENTAGVRRSGADAESGHPNVEKDGDPALGGMIEVRVACDEGHRAKVEAVLREAGGRGVRGG